MIKSLSYNYKSSRLIKVDVPNQTAFITHSQLIACLNHQNGLNLKDTAFISYIEQVDATSYKIWLEQNSIATTLDIREVSWNL